MTYPIRYWLNPPMNGEDIFSNDLPDGRAGFLPLAWARLHNALARHVAGR